MKEKRKKGKEGGRKICIKGCSAVFHSLKLYKNQMYTSNLLKMQVWDTNLQQTTGLLIIKIPVELFSQCVLFLWRRKKKVIWNWATFILSSLVNMLPQQPSSCYLGKDRCLCFNQNAKLKEAKKKRFGGGSNENSSFHYLKCELLWAGFEP